MANKTVTETISLYNGNVEVTFYPNSHRYKIAGENIISVTGATGIIDKSRPLIHWATGLARDYLYNFIAENEDFSIDALKDAVAEAVRQHQVKKDDAADIGKQVHKWCELYIKSKIDNGDEPELPEDKNVMNGVTAFLQWTTEHKVKFIASECVVYSKKHNYIGTFDATAEIDGDFCIMDFKTSKGVYNDFYYQLSGYRGAYEEEKGNKVDKSLIIHFNKENGEFKVYPAEDHDKDYKTFLACLTIKKREKELK